LRNRRDIWESDWEMGRAIEPAMSGNSRKCPRGVVLEPENARGEFLTSFV